MNSELVKSDFSGIFMSFSDVQFRLEDRKVHTVKINRKGIKHILH